MIRIGTAAHEAAEAAPEQDPIERAVLGWPSRLVAGSVEYYDVVADLWRPFDESVTQLRRRRGAQHILGSQRDADAVTAYERRLGL